LALSYQLKKGGPYTEDERERRRKEVYRLHFEMGYSAVQIAEKLAVNRNTINEYIKYWNFQICHDVCMDQLSLLVSTQIHRLELQRKRLLEDLETKHDFKEKMIIEKRIFDIDNRLSQMVTKFVTSDKFRARFPENKIFIEDEEVSDLLISLPKNSKNHKQGFTKKDLLDEVIRIKKCDPRYAESFVEKLMELGLNHYKIPDTSSIFLSDYQDRYDLGEFSKVSSNNTFDEKLPSSA